MKLFICSTPLHCAIANAIIVKNKYKKEECQLFYFSFKNKNKEIHKYYFSLLAEKCKRADFVCVERILAFELPKLVSHFYKSKFSVIHAANIDMPLVHFILSYCYFEHFCSFDDGIGNIVPTSVFYKSKPRTIKFAIRDALYRTLGNRLNLEKIKQSTKKHYTIYKGCENVIANTELVVPDFFTDAITLPVSVADKSKRATVILGTVYNELVSSAGDQSALIYRVQEFIYSKKNVYIIPHPRDRETYFTDVIQFAVNDVAENILLNLKHHYAGVDVFGFTSSAQFNLSAYPEFNQYYFSSELIKSGYINYMQQAELFGFLSVDLDDIKNEG